MAVWVKRKGFCAIERMWRRRRVGLCTRRTRAKARDINGSIEMHRNTLYSDPERGSFLTISRL